MSHIGGPMRCKVALVTHKDFNLTWRRAEPRDENDNNRPTWNYWGAETDGEIIKGKIDSSGRAILQMNTRHLLGHSNYIHYTLRIPKLDKSFKVKLRFNFVKGDENATIRTSFVWYWEDKDAAPYLNISEGTDSLSADRWSLEREVQINPSELASKALTIDSQAVPFVKAVKVVPLLPLYTVDQDNRRCKFDSNGMEIYSASQPSATIPTPAAVARGPTPLTFDVRIAKSGMTTEPFKLYGTFAPKKGWETSLWYSTVINIAIDPRTSQALIAPTIRIPSEYLPSGFEGNIEWVVALATDPDLTVPLKKFTTPVEFYMLPANVPKFISDGLPAQILRIMLQTRFNDYSDNYQGWIKYCMNFLRTQNFRYETIGGKYNYSDYPGGSLVETQCYLEHWLSHYDELRDEHNKDRQRRVNCYDLAALGQVMLAIGLDEDQHKLKMKFLEPYGMINPTELIGFPKRQCNSPFFEDAKPGSLWDDRPLWPKDSKKYRSGFSNHAFLAVVADGTEKVIDATCGPQIGTLTMDEYIEKAIDHEATRTLVWNEGKNKGQPLKKEGFAKDVREGRGVTGIVSPVDVQQYTKENPPQVGLIWRINTAASATSDRRIFPTGDLGTPSTHTDGSILSISWLFRPKDGNRTGTIDIIFYNSGGALQNLEYLNRKAMFEAAAGSEASQFQDIKTLFDVEKHELVRQGTARFDDDAVEPFALWQQGLEEQKTEKVGIVVIVKGFKQSDMKSLVKGLVNIIDADLKDRREVTGDLVVNCQSEDGKHIDPNQVISVHKGESFNITTTCTVKNEAGSEIQIVGANVATKEGRVVYLEPEFIKGTKLLKFSFHARREGTDEVTVTYLTTHLHEKSVTRKVNVGKQQAIARAP